MAKYGGQLTRLLKPGGGAVPYRRRRTISFDFGAVFDALFDLGRSAYRQIRNSRPLFIGILAGLLAAFLVSLGLDFYRVISLGRQLPNLTTKIYDKNDILISELFRQKREVVTLKRIPKELANALIAIEDNDFYDHFGINPKAIVRAFFVNLTSGSVKQGGSTITQQVSKLMLTSGKRNIFRKIKEAFIALMMEAVYSKKEILGLYLNQIFLGQGSYGVEAASQLYFSKHVEDLNLAECALLATLPTAPNRYSPFRHTNRSIQRHKLVLAKMIEMGTVSREEAERAFMEFWPEYLERIRNTDPTQTAASLRTDRAPWFTEYVRRKLVAKYGEETVFDKGLLVYTTLDVKKQEAAQNVLRETLGRQSSVSSEMSYRNDEFIADNYTDLVMLLSDLFDMGEFKKKGSREIMRLNDHIRENVAEELEGLNLLAGLENVDKFLDLYHETFFGEKGYQKVEGCVIGINQNNGFIEILVGGSEFTGVNQLNRAMQAKRQPGSAIKPLLYAAALEDSDFTPASMIFDSPTPYLDEEGGEWMPENYDGEYYGLVSLRKALAMSINVASIKIAEKIGIEKVIKYYAKFFGLSAAAAKARIPRDLSISIGTMEVSPFELTRAYAIIANGGKDVAPFSIRKVLDRKGKVLEDNETVAAEELDKRKKSGTLQIIKPETAQLMISLMRGVISHGTGSGASIGRPAAGKTGTTSNWKDAWFVGFVPQLTTGIWIGYDKLGLSLGSGQAGGAIAAPAWSAMMRKGLSEEPAIEFPIYAGLVEREVCIRTGFLAGSLCRQTIKELFIPGKVPDKECEKCTGRETASDAVKKGPRDNISGDQKKSIMKSIQKKDEDVTDDVENDILE